MDSNIMKKKMVHLLKYVNKKKQIQLEKKRMTQFITPQWMFEEKKWQFRVIPMVEERRLIEAIVTLDNLGKLCNSSDMND